MNTQITNSLKLTENEILALKICLNYDNREGQLSDNFSNGDMDEFCAQLGWNKHQVSALMGSLEAKGMGFYDADDDLFWLSEHGVHTIFDIIEAEQAAA